MNQEDDITPSATDKQTLNDQDFKSIVIESNEFTLEDLSQMPNYQQRRYQDAIYMGQIVNGKRHGKGVMRYKNKR